MAASRDSGLKIPATRKAKATTASIDLLPTRSVPDRDAVAPDRAGQVADGVLLAMFLGLVGLLGAFPVLDTDFWWHLKAGDLIRRTGAVPTIDTFTFGAAGHRWTDLHWVFQLLCSWGYERVGVAGLNVGKCVVTTAAVAFLVTSGRREWPTWATLLAWVPALLVLSGRMYLRPETLTLFYLACDVAILARWDRRPLLGLLLPVVQLLWVNSQGLFVFGPVLVVVALLDAAARRGAFGAERRLWWRIALVSLLGTLVACLINPYALRGAVYPIELLGTMGDPLFRQSIAELKTIPTLFGETGFNLLPLNVHFATFGLGVVSFLAPAWWRVVTGFRDRRLGPVLPVADGAAKPARRGKASRRVRGAASDPADDGSIAPGRPLRWFRLAVFAMFGALGFTANRNSHQFAAMVGTITAWNLAEWAAEVAARLRRTRAGAAEVNSSPRPRRFGPRLLTAGVLAAVVLMVGSGRYYAWSGEGRTIGLGEEPNWYPHEAVEFAGGPGLPEHNVCFHNGHASLFEYRWAPERQTYTDARLEVMGPDLYRAYLDLQRQIAGDRPGWPEALARLGAPSVLVDNTHPDDGVGTTLLLSRHYRCVYFDAIAAVFVPAALAPVVERHHVDFLARHYAGEAAAASGDPAALLAMTKALKGVATVATQRPGGETTARALIRLAQDYARRLRVEHPDELDGWKQAGLLDFLQIPPPGAKPTPRFRLPFDPAIDLPIVRAAFELNRAAGIEPNDRIVLWELGLLAQAGGMDEVAVPWLERFARQPTQLVAHQTAVAAAADGIAESRRRLGATPPTTWRNLSELEQVVDRLARSGRPLAAVEVGEGAHRADARPWAWADRLATIRLHLGQPDRARELWRDATDAPPALQAARVALTLQIEGNDDLARRHFAQALAADPNLFEAHFGLAGLEQRLGRAEAAVVAARAALAHAPDDRTRLAARQILAEATPYAPAPAPASGPPR